MAEKDVVKMNDSKIQEVRLHKEENSGEHLRMLKTENQGEALDTSF